MIFVQPKQKIEHCIRQNSAIDIYEDYWKDLDSSVLLVEEDPIKTMDVVRDPLAGQGLDLATVELQKKPTLCPRELSVTKKKKLTTGNSTGSADESRLMVKEIRKSRDEDLGACAIDERRGSHTTMATTADGFTKDVAEKPKPSKKFQGRGVTCINFAPGLNSRKVAAAYSSTVFQCPLVDVPRTAYVWDISE